jgi:hypothetical protein
MTALLALAGGALLITAAWIALAAVLAGVGLLFRRRWRRSEPLERDEGFALVWTGYALVVLLLQSWHFFAPVNGWSLGIVVALGAIGWMANVRAVAPALRGGLRLSENRVPLALFVVFLLWAANRCAGPLSLYDSGMYHAPTVEWFKSYPIVPGLGNLHGRLAFNPSSLLFAAMLDRGPFTSGASHLANGFVLVLLAAEVLRRGVRLARGYRERTRTDLMAVVLLPAIVMMFVRQDARSLSTDVAVTALIMAAGLRLFDVLQYPSLVRQRRAYDVRALALLFAVAVCVKLSAAVFAAGALILAVYAALRGPHSAAVGARALAGAAVFPVLLIGTWLTRGIVLSGYPMYPVRLFAAPVDWRVTAEQAGAEAGWVVMSARYLNTNNIGVGFDWISLWLGDILTRGDLFVHITVPLIVSVSAAGYALIQRRRIANDRAKASVPDETSAGRVALLFGAMLGVNALVWFLTAPHTRFGQSTFWLAAGLAVQMLFAPAVNAGGARSAIVRGRLWRSAVALTGLLWVGHVGGIAMRGEEHFSWRWLAQQFVTVPIPGVWLQPMPRPELVRYVTSSGLELQVPAKDNSCWNGPLLCTPHPAPNVAFRHGTDPGSGFVTRGAWAATRFPNPWTPFLILWRCQQELSYLRASDRDRTCLQRALADRPGPGA